jgi:hypothetical protein
MIEKGQYDTAYHEHLSFFTVRSMDIAGKMADLNESIMILYSKYLLNFSSENFII